MALEWLLSNPEEPTDAVAAQPVEAPAADIALSFPETADSEHASTSKAWIRPLLSLEYLESGLSDAFTLKRMQLNPLGRHVRQWLVIKTCHAQHLPLCVARFWVVWKFPYTLHLLLHVLQKHRQRAVR